MSKARLVLMTALVAAALLAGVAVGVMLTRFVSIGTARTTPTAVAVVREIQTLSQLVTVQYVIQKVVDEQDVKWYGQNRVLLVAFGVVKAGVDLERLKPDDVTVDGTRITIKLPPAQILDAYLDESRTEILDRSTGLLRMFDNNLETVARQHAVMDIRRAARNQGILQDAESRARIQLEALLHRLGFEQVEVVFP